ncbi:uncharacterized protein LOC110688926 [Chenopodium quinoa]|uniref:uncharacterized protein LOC110688926 n=1 Tax=Chenopodium quinoa TaxID=63459 RepID=UPI000B774DFD|nr:uncharacterized protein LOC110688926 [Chenopodium quinoa]
MFVYGSPHVANRLEVWHLISSLLEIYPNIVIIGDFNQVEFYSDKLVGNFAIPGQLDFINWRMGLNLVDVPFSGPKYTWTNNRLDSDPIFERLDKAYGSSTWFANYPDTHLVHQPILFSDHAAIILSDSIDPDHFKQPYRVENWCLSAVEVQGIITSVFSLFFPGSPMFSLSRKLSVSRDHRCLFITVRNEKVAEAQAAYLFWQQRAKLKWDALGDSHSRLFFSVVQSRKRKNRISGLRDSSGVWQRDGAQVAAMIQEFYKDLYSVTVQPSDHDHEWWDSLQLPSLSSDHQNILMRPFTPEEIRVAIFSIDDSKSPGPDGFSSAFFKKSWDTVGNSVVADVQHFFAHGYLLKHWNRTFLVLLPKVDNPEGISQYRPIGRLRQILPSLVADGQNAFVPGRLLSDNALIAHEVMTYINKTKARKKFFVAIKLDMNKAYDRVNWDFLFRLLQAYDFPPYWIHIIRQCVSTVSYQVLVINLQKSYVKFSPNTPMDYRDFLAHSLRLHCKPALGSYLELPVDLGRSKISDFGFLVDKVVQRLLSFASLGLSSAAKLVIINSIMVASFNHVLSVFKGQAVLSKGIAWKVGSGSHVRIIEDSWVPGEPLFFGMMDWISRGLAVQDFKAFRQISTTGTYSNQRPSWLPLCLQGSSDAIYEICLVVDGAYDAHDNSAGAGWVFRAAGSDTVIGGGTRAFLSSSALHSEVQALH